MADEFEKKLMRLKKDDLKDEARKRRLSETGTKADLVNKQFIYVNKYLVKCQNLPVM